MFPMQNITTAERPNDTPDTQDGPDVRPTGRNAEGNRRSDPRSGPARADGHDWRVAGDAWGHAADDWSTLFEHYAVEVVAAIADRVGAAPTTRLLDVACGSGWAMRFLRGRGADVAGIDAAARLLEVAGERNPTSELVHGSMFDLPWAAGSFDAVVSINGIWGGGEDALVEAHRVLRPGGRIGLSFWGSGEPLDLRPFFLAVAGHLDRGHIAGMVSINDIATPGVAEQMLGAAGFEVLERGRRVSVLEWPDEEVAWRALRSVGPIVPALRDSDPDVVRRDALAAIERCRTTRGTYRFENVQDFVIARRP